MEESSGLLKRFNLRRAEIDQVCVVDPNRLVKQHTNRTSGGWTRTNDPRLMKPGDT